jgi:hypothetical protein
MYVKNITRSTKRYTTVFGKLFLRVVNSSRAGTRSDGLERSVIQQLMKNAVTVVDYGGC